MNLTRALGAVAIATTLTACATPSTDTTAERTTVEQTWAKPYAKTTCGDWVSKMTRQQNARGAADLLLAAQRTDFPEAGPEVDETLAAAFQDSITQYCSIASTRPDSLTEAASVLYSISAADYKP